MPPEKPAVAVASTGKDLRYISGITWSGYSGEITVAQNTNTNLLDFVSPNVGLSTTICYGTYDVDLDSGRRMFSDIKFNGLRVLRRTAFYNPATGAIRNAIFDLPIYIVIPPLTVVEIAVEHDDPTSIPFTVTIVATEV